MLKQISLMGNCMGKKGKASQQVTLAILGLDNAGKTVTTKGLQGEPLDTVAPTVGFSSVDFRFEKWNITLFDLGGGKRIRDIWKNYFSEVYGVIYVIDSSEPERLEECASVLNGLIEHPKVAGKPILVLANKQDVKGAMDEIDICDGLRLEELVNMHKCPCRVYKKCPHLKATAAATTTESTVNKYQDDASLHKTPAKLEMCSAVLGQGKKLDKSIRLGMQWLLGYIRENWDDYEERVKLDMEEHQQREKQEKKERAERVRKIREERERKEKEERRARGEAEEEEDDEQDIVDGGGPFKQLNYDDLKKKEAQMKEEKRRKKEEASKKKQAAADDSSEEERPTRRRRQLNLPDGSDDNDDEPVPSQRSIRSHRSPRPLAKSLMDEPLSARSNDPATGGPLPPLRRSFPADPSPRLSRRGHHGRSRDDDDNDDDDDDDDEDDIGSYNNAAKWRKKKGTPRPEDLYQGRDYGGEEKENDYISPPMKRGGALAPIGHVGHLEPLEQLSEASKKKKKKKKAKKNQTMPSPAEDDAPRGWPGSSGMRASRSPTLGTTQEEEEEQTDFSRKWGLLNDDLDDSPPAPQRRSRPNSEYDDEIVT